MTLEFKEEWRMVKKRAETSKVLVLVCAMLWVSGAGAALADDVTDSMEEAIKYYKSGNLAEAMSSLDYASQIIRQKRGGNLQSLLPGPLPGWKAKDATSQAAGAAMFGGAVSAERKYQKGSSNVAVKIVTDSPMLQGMLMMLYNPAVAGAKGGELQKIKGQKAIVKYKPSTRRGEIQIVVANRFLVTVEGHGVTQDDLMDYASAIPLEKLESF
jgi:hypothetical protein